MFTAPPVSDSDSGHAAATAPRDQGHPPGGRLLDTASVVEVVEHLRSHGYDAILTSALAPDEQPALPRRRLPDQEHLHLLLAQTRPDVAPTSRRTRRMRRSDLSRVLEIDASAFTPFWRLDRTAFHEATSATPSCRRRVVSVGDPLRRHVVGYAVTGRSEGQGFVQRLAVDPAHQGTGIGRALLDDALHWLAQQGATTVLVNTQPDNDAALDLYRSAGFTDRPGGLSVLRLDARPS